MTYTAPVDRIARAMHTHVAPPSADERDVLASFGRFVTEVYAPLQTVGDTHGAHRAVDGAVVLPPGFDAAYRQFANGGWQGLRHGEDAGGAGLSNALAAACTEMANGACLSFALATLLTDGAIEAVAHAGSDDQRGRWLPPLVSGQWTGTMNLTEPQSGSDLAAIRCRARPVDGGRYAIEGTKIFISYGDHTMASNILHLVLARLPDAPAGIAGISLFAVPMWHADGTRNGVVLASLEHKLGLHGSPTCTLRFGGDGQPALGELIGPPHGGLDLMFVMMNAARFGVGVQAVGLSERALQTAVAYARERVQSRRVGAVGGDAVAIHQHPDVQRMLMTMQVLTDGGRALYLHAAAAKDEGARARFELLVPVVKGWCTERVQEVTSLAIQVFGGHGYIEESGVAQLYRDARILALYEGTTAIQANDLVYRKVLRDDGAAVRELLEAVWDAEADLLASGTLDLVAIRRPLVAASEALEAALGHVLRRGREDTVAVAGCAVEFLMLLGDVVVGWRLAEAALQADADTFTQRTAVFYADHVLARCVGRAAVIVAAAPVVEAWV